MRSFGLDPFKTEQATSTGTGDVKTLTSPQGTTAVLITVSTTPARVTFDGSTPSSGNGNVIPVGTMPLLLTFRSGQPIKFVSTAAAASTVDVTWFA